MARETKEQRAERDARERQVLEDERQEYLKTVPARLAAAEQLARSLGISTKITLTEGGPNVHFRDDNSGFDDFANYLIDEWELEDLEGRLASLKRAQEERAARRVLAQTVWDRCTPEERVALKENLVWMR